MRYIYKSLVVAAMLMVPAMASCFYSPTGSNTAAGIYPSPVGGLITLTYVPQDVNAASVTFTVEGSATVAIPVDDSPNDGFKAVIDGTKLPPGPYTIDCKEDTGVTGFLTLIVPLGAGTDSGASSTATGAASPAASPSTASSGAATTPPASGT